MLRIAMLSKWHVHAGGYAKMAMDYPDSTVTCVWDEDPRRGQAWADELGVDFVPCLDELLAREDVDAVVCDAPTSKHTEIMIKAANAGKHIFTEKVATLTAPEAQELKKAILANNVIFTISFPQRAQAKFLFAKKLVDDGVLGDVTMFRVRNGHAGATRNWLPNYWYDPETTGGGAMMDLGCHPMYLARWIFGEAESISSTFSYYTHHMVEDSAVCSILFKNNTIGVVESSLASICSPYILEIYGTEATYYVNEQGAMLSTKEADDELVPIEFPEDIKNLKAPLYQFIDSCVHGTPVLYDIDEAIGLTELMDAAYRSGREHRTVKISEVYEGK